MHSTNLVVTWFRRWDVTNHEATWSIVICYMTTLKYLIWLAKTSFHWLWQIFYVQQWWAKFSPGLVYIRVFSADRQLNINWIKFSPVQVDITLFTAAWQLNIDIGNCFKIFHEFYVCFTGQMFWIKNLFILWEQ